MLRPQISGLDEVRQKDRLLGVVIRAGFSIEKTTFITPESSPQQVGLLKFSREETIRPHIHNCVPREVSRTQEVLVVSSGRVRIDFYDEDLMFADRRVVEQGDVVFLCTGGHGFYFLEDTSIIEIKNGPYVGASDNTKFDPIG